MKTLFATAALFLVLTSATAHAECSVAEKTLRDAQGRRLGEIRGGAHQMSLYDKNGRFLGSYHCQNNQTRDEHGRLVGSGNLLASLLRP